MYKRLEQCLCCGNSELFTVLDLGQQPPANSFHSLGEHLEEYELKLQGCGRCWHTQLSIAVDPAELFRHYLYVSGTSATLQDYFKWFAKAYHIIDPVNEPRVLDIACNDGSQLNYFRNLGWETWGVDPAENLVPVAKAKGHKVVCDFWSPAVAAKLPQFDLIVAQNVFAHTAEINEFLEACKMVMRDDTTLVIQTSQANMFDNNEFDTIYHEHISFFSTRSMRAICKRHRLFLNSVYKTDIHGTSYVFEIGLRPRNRRGVLEQLRLERHRYRRSFFNNYQRQALSCLSNLKSYVEDQRSQGKTVVGYGAAAKGMTVLNAGDITLDYIVDDNPLKQSLLTPGMNIAIYGSDQLQQENSNLVIVPLAWNFYDEIRSRVKTLRPNNEDLFVRYFPELTVSL